LSARVPIIFVFFFVLIPFDVRIRFDDDRWTISIYIYISKYTRSFELFIVPRTLFARLVLRPRTRRFTFHYTGDEPIFFFKRLCPRSVTCLNNKCVSDARVCDKNDGIEEPSIEGGSTISVIEILGK